MIFKVSFNTQIKRNGQYVSIFKFIPYDWCKFVASTTSKKTNFQRLFIKVFKGAKEFFKKCPYDGTYKAMNFSVPSDVITVVPKGSYKVGLYVADKNDTVIFGVQATVSVFN